MQAWRLSEIRFEDLSRSVIRLNSGEVSYDAREYPEALRIASGYPSDADDERYERLWM
jgi:hypothetical protein